MLGSKGSPISFNPSVGILWGGTRPAAPSAAAARGFNPSVGILWGGTLRPRGGGYAPSGFNPSVGILWGGTPRRPRSAGPGRPFQSLGRDSVGWDYNTGAEIRVFGGVSIPRSGFCGVGRCDADHPSVSESVFQSLGRDSVGWDSMTDNQPGPHQAGFQSLGRDSVGWDSGPHL